ncbi:MAG TPA: hypothetical protein VGI92_07385 [Gemmatimonadales bacterium]|jgi:predicted metalloprotease with PDZ domain
MKLLGLLLAAVPATLSAQVSAPITNVSYELTFDSAAAAQRSVQVAMSFEVAGPAPVLLSLPAWAPGHYEIMNFSRNVAHFTATQNGQPLHADRFDYDTWRVIPSGRGAVRVGFDFKADTLQTAAAWTAPDFLMVNGTNVFLFPQGRSLEYPATVTVHTRPDWRVVTGMHAAGGPLTYHESNYHDLADMPFFIGRFDVDSNMVSGKWTRLASYPAGRMSGAPRTAMWSAMQKFIPAETAVFGETPWDDYTVFMIVVDNFGGATALEHQSGNVGIYGTTVIAAPGIPNVVAHEMFHAFNVKRLRPAEMFPYRYDEANPTTLLWVSEGFSDYYADLDEVRGGAIDSAAFAQNTLGHMQVVGASPPASVEDASLAIWTHTRDGSDFLYYDKGSVLGFLLDIMIRDASDNHGSLDGVMRSLYESAWKHHRGFTNEEFWAAASRAAGGKSFAAFYDHYVDGHDPLPYDSIVPLAGFRYSSETFRAPRLGIGTASDSLTTVTQVIPGGAYERAGGHVGDTLVTLGGVDVRTDPNFDAFRHRWAGKDGTFPIVVRRAGQVLTLTAPVMLIERTDVRLDYAADASPKALRIRNGILHGAAQ